jgi:hypothetical protein
MRALLLLLVLAGAAFAAWTVLAPGPEPVASDVTGDGAPAPERPSAPRVPGVPEMRQEASGEVGEPTPEDRMPPERPDEVDWMKLRVLPDGPGGTVSGKAALAAFRKAFRVRFPTPTDLSAAEALEIRGIPAEGVGLAELMPRIEAEGFQVMVEPPVCVIRRTR